jgi:hypothetical protein
MNSLRSKLRDITSASPHFADDKDFFWFVIHPTLQGEGNSELKTKMRHMGYDYYTNPFTYIICRGRD